MRVARAVGFACCVFLWARAASAAEYETFIDIETEEDLYDLLFTEQISDRSFDALLLLYQTRLDLNRADRHQLYLLPNLDYAHVDRILEYRRQVGTIGSLGDLSAAGVLPTRLTRTLEAFVTVRSPDSGRSKVQGFARLQSRWTGRYDRLPPAVAMQARVRALEGLDTGMAATLTRNRLGRPRWDRDRSALSAAPEGVRFEMPKLYVSWQAPTWEVVAGTYRIGFGQRLTFDVTDQISPNGAFGDYELRWGNVLGLGCRRTAGELPASPCPTTRVVRVTPDYGWTNRLAGVAAGVKRITAGKGWLQAYAWSSLQPHSVAQSEIANASRCADPRRDGDVACAPPQVYVRGADGSARFATASRATVSAAFAEWLGGGHASYFWNARTHLGVTGYGAVPRWLIRGPALDFQESARRPFGGPFGAAGLEAAVGLGAHDLFVEVARSFDAQKGGGGGYAAVIRCVTTIDGGEIDASLRYFGTGYANPYARPVSAPDELDGLRARDEAGVRVRATAALGSRVGLRVIGDVWWRLSLRALGSLLFVRADVELAPAFTWALWAEYRSGIGQRFVLATRIAYARSPRFKVSGQLRHRWAGASRTALLTRDVAAIAELASRPVERLRMRARVRYDFDDVADNHRLPQTLWALVELGLHARERDLIRVRYDFRIYLDERESTRARVPNPEHWLWLEYVLRF